MTMFRDGRNLLWSERQEFLYDVGLAGEPISVLSRPHFREEVEEMYGPLVEIPALARRPHDPEDPWACESCGYTGWVYWEANSGVYGTGCPACEIGRDRLARGVPREVQP